MFLAVTIVLSGFGLLYLAVSSEERHIQKGDPTAKTLGYSAPSNPASRSIHRS